MLGMGQEYSAPVVAVQSAVCGYTVAAGVVIARNWLCKGPVIGAESRPAGMLWSRVDEKKAEDWIAILLKAPRIVPAR